MTTLEQMESFAVTGDLKAVLHEILVDQLELLVKSNGLPAVLGALAEVCQKC